ncbi:hypothetical protein AB6D05_15310 [Vibrio cyclitrophicus]
MSKVLPFRNKAQPPSSDVPEKPSPSAIFENCRFEENTVGAVFEDYDFEMKNTDFVKNGIGVVAGTNDEQLLKILSQCSAMERFKFAGELSEISKVEDGTQQEKMLRESSIVKKLAVLSDVATATAWLKDIYDGISTIDLETLIQKLMGG